VTGVVVVATREATCFGGRCLLWPIKGRADA
jgi:hypothetical protein